MATTTAIPMPDPLLTLAQWLSPGFPIGAYAYSHGLETAIAEGEIGTARQLQDWLEDLCHFGAARSDMALLAAAHAPAAPLDQIDATARAFTASAERLKETQLQGAAFVDTVNAVWGLNLPHLTYPVALGAAARAMEIPLPDTARLAVQSFLANLVSAAVRLVPLGQTEGQRVLADIAPLVLTTAQEGIQTPLAALSSATFRADIAAMRHETLETRIFRT